MLTLHLTPGTRALLRASLGYFEHEMVRLAEMCLLPRHHRRATSPLLGKLAEDADGAHARAALRKRRARRAKGAVAAALAAGRAVWPPEDHFDPAFCKQPWVRNSLGLNDIFVLHLALHDFPGVRSGWFANLLHGGCYADAAKRADRIVGGLCNVCPVATPDERFADAKKSRPWGGAPPPIADDGLGADGPRAARRAAQNAYPGSLRDPPPLASPWTVDRYIAHHKEGSGIMARQHDETHPKMEKKHKTKDAALLVPPGYRPRGSHIDVRCACMDKRAARGRPAALLNITTHAQCHDSEEFRY